MFSCRRPLQMLLRHTPRRSRPKQDGVERAGAALAPLEREVLALSAGRDLRNDEIAARLGIPERRVERVLARALRKFDRALRPPDHHGRKFW